MKTARAVLAGLFFLVSAVLLLIAISALHPRIDAARMLLAANGSIIRGFAGVAVFSAVAGWVAAVAGGRSTPRLGACSRIVGVLALAAGAANIATWMSGLDRRAVAFESDGVRLEGTLMLPARVSRPPVAIIVHGSPALTRDFYAVWGRHLVHEGIAVLVYDKRGTGASEGSVPRNNDDPDYLAQLGRDAAAAFSAAQAQPDIDRGRISLVGISQGGWTVPVAASLQPSAYRLAFLSAPVATTNEERAFSQVAGDGGSGGDDHDAIQAGDRAAAGAPSGGFDPVPFLMACRMPGRWFFGERDRSIPVSLSTQRLDKLRGAGRNVGVVTFANADHLLFDAAWLPPGFTAPLMPALAAWLKGQAP